MREEKQVRPSEDVLSAPASLRELSIKAKDCRNCALWKRATQTVFGEGSANARIMLIGEQPGNEEDRTGRPFVGPAGRLMDRLLAEVGIERKNTYVTNVVKHFKFKSRGKRRIHEKPQGKEIAACRPWLEAEIAALEPFVIVCLGATAAKALLGSKFRVSVQHGEFVESPLAPRVLATIHPSAILRAPEKKMRHQLERQFVADLTVVAKLKMQ